MGQVWLQSALWIGLALVASIVSIRVAISVALIEIMVGALARQCDRPAADGMGEFLAGFGAIMLTFLAGTEIDPRRGAQALPFRPVDRRRRLLRALSRRPRLRPLRDPLAMGSGADRRNLAVDDVGGGRLRGDDRDRLQSHRDRQDHSRRLLRQRPRHGAGPRRGVRALRHAARRSSARRPPRSCGCCRGSRRGSSPRSAIGSASRKRNSSR